MSPPIKVDQFAHLHRKSSAPRRDFLYALELPNGLVKIGKTFSPRGRLRTLHKEHGVSRYFVTGPVGRLDAYALERRAIDRLLQIGNAVRGRREYFADVKFGEASNIVRKLALRAAE